MTSILSYNSSSSSDLTAQTLGVSSILSYTKYPTTFIIQPDTSNLLSKRFKTSEFGDILMKKFKSHSTNSSNQSPTKDAYDSSDSMSNMEEELASPTINLSSQLLSLTKPTISSPNKQLLNALDTLQKKLVEYQVSSLRDAMIKAQFAQQPLVIPSLQSSEKSSVSPVKRIISNLQSDDDELEIYYGEVEYPLLHLAPKNVQIEESKKVSKSTSSAKIKGAKSKRATKSTNCSSPDDSIFESLAATREATQLSESDMNMNLREFSEKIAQVMEKKNKKSKKSAKNEESVMSEEIVEKVKKTEKKEKMVEIVAEKEKKGKGKKEVKDEMLSPVSKGKRTTERRKNRWQLQEEKIGSPNSEKFEGEDDKACILVGPNHQVDLPVLRAKGENRMRKVLKMKWNPSSVDENELQSFFEQLRNLLKFNLEEEKAIALLQANGNNANKVLNAVKVNKSKFLNELNIAKTN